MKRIIKIFGGIVGGILLLFIIASVVILLMVNKKMVEKQIEKALHRHVTIEEVSVGIFSVVSGIEVKNVALSNYKSDAQLKALEGKPVRDVFVSLKKLNLKLKFLPLLQKKFELNEFVLYNPTINVVRYRSGAYNFSDLLQPKKLTPEERKELAKKKAEKEKKGEKDEPFTAETIPLAITVGKMGVQGGTVNYLSAKTGQRFQLYNLEAKVYAVDIDPENLEKRNSLKIFLKTGIKTVGPSRTGSVKTFDLGLRADGVVKPFDLKSKQINPEVSAKVHMPYGSITGLQIFNAIANMEKLQKYIGNSLDFMKGTFSWKESKAAYVDIWYKGNIIKFSNGRIPTKEGDVAFEGTTNYKTTAINLMIDMILSEKRTGIIKTGLRKQVESALKKMGIDKYVDKQKTPEKVATVGMEPLINKDGRVYFRFNMTGSLSNPKPTLTHPELKSLDLMIKSVVGDVIKEVGKDAAKKAVEDGLKKLIDKGKRDIKLPKIKF